MSFSNYFYIIENLFWPPKAKIFQNLEKIFLGKEKFVKIEKSTKLDYLFIDA